MNRAGREPAEDVKRRFVAACQEVGLEIQDANMIRNPEDGSRTIVVGAIPENWEQDTPMLSLMTTVGADGGWSQTVDVRCVANDGAEHHLGHSPWMNGRNRVPLADLVSQLRETLAERTEVISRVEQGIDGPYEFPSAVWKVVDLLGDMNL